MIQIKSLNELIKKLTQSNAENYVSIAKNMHIPTSDFKPYIFWKEDGYSRNCIIKNDDFELILICWKKGHITPIHGHNNQKCWVYQIDGEMTEVRYQIDSLGKMTECNRINLTPGKLCYMHDTMGYHLLENKSNGNAMTLHLYMKPVNKCAIYNTEKSAFEDKDLSFDTIDGKKV